MNNKIYPFHNSIESGLRVLISLYEIHPKGTSFERLHYYDYMIVHTGDFDGPVSLHANFPHRNGEYLVRRKVIEEGIELLRRKGLVTLELSTDGIEYILTEDAGDYILSLSKPYIKELKSRIAWINQTFSHLSDNNLREMFNKKMDKWDSYLEFQSIGEGMLL